MIKINMPKILLKTITLVLILALNLLSYPDVEVEAAARLTNVSDTLSRLKVSTTANHSTVFRITTAIQGGGGGAGGTLGDKIVIDWNIGGFTVASLSGGPSGDIELYRGGTGSSPSWGSAYYPVATRTAANEDIFSVSSNVLTITIGNGTNALGNTELVANTWVKVVVKNNKITNPGTTGLKKIYVKTTENDGTVDDDAYTAVYILTDDQVVLQATVEPLFSFEILGGMANGTQPNAIDFGTLEPDAYHKLLGAITAYAGIKFTANPSNNETVTVRSQTYTFKSNQSEADDQSYYVFIGDTPSDTAANLSRAINNTDSTYVKSNIDPGDSTQVWIVAVTAGTTGNSYAISDGTGGDVTLTKDADNTFINGQNGSNYKDTNLGYGETDGTDVGNEAWGTHLRISTNAAYGYIITVQDTGFTSGANEIADWSGQYGWGLWAKCRSPRYGECDPAANEIISDAFDVDTGDTPGTLTTSPATLASYSGPSAGDNIAIEYNIRIGVDQPAGRYTDTLTYIATSNY
jgi:hypothetical protein